jgi:hypothetical protein
MKVINGSLAGLVLAGILAIVPTAALAHGGGGGGLAEEAGALVEGMVEASVVAVAISAAEAISVVVAISLAVAISLGLLGVVLAAIASQNTEERTSNTKIISGTEIISGTIAISFLEVLFCMIIPTTGMIIPTTGIIIRTRTTDIRTTDIMRTTAFAVSWFQSGRRTPIAGQIDDLTLKALQGGFGTLC